MRHGLSARIALRLLFACMLAAGTLGVVLRSGVATATPGAVDRQELAALRLPPGFHINVFAEGLGYVRFMTFSPRGDLVATSSSRELYGERCNGGNCPANEGRIFILPDRDHRGVADSTVVFADGLDRPQGVTYRDGVLYVAEHGRVVRLPDPTGAMRAAATEVVVSNLPFNQHPGHWSRTIAFGPDDKLYVSAGSDCNVCQEDDERRAAITQYSAAGTNERVFARGLRNAVGLAIQPTTGELWATVQGRDLLGDDFPPEYLTVVHDGDHFGWPFCHVGTTDPDFGSLGDCAQTRQPTVQLPAHSSALGLVFYTGQQFPPEYRGDLFVALHGSWNRSVPQGYKVVRIPMAGGVPGPAEDFISGFLPASPGCDNLPADASRDTAVCRANAWGRPVGFAIGPDGAMYLSDDRAGAIYRITYSGTP